MIYTDPQQIDDRLASLIQQLSEHENVEAAQILQDVQDGAYATGSEWRGDLGRAIKEVKRRFNLAPELRSELDWLLGRVREVWPSI